MLMIKKNGDQIDSISSIWMDRHQNFASEWPDCWRVTKETSVRKLISSI